VVDAFARATQRGGGLVLNVSTGKETSVLELYRLVATATGSNLEPRMEPERAGELARSALDPSRAALHLGWAPWTSVAAGVEAVVAHMRRVGSP